MNQRHLVPPCGAPGTPELLESIRDLASPLAFVEGPREQLLRVEGGEIHWPTRSGTASENDRHPVVAFAPPTPPQALGDASFTADYGVRFPYVAGAMANGIASVELVRATAHAGMLAFFGAAGLPIDDVARAIDELASLGDLPYGFNLIHSPNEPNLESETVALYIARGIRLVEASAFLDLTLPVVRYRVHGIHRTADGRVVCPNRLIAKASRIEVASKFFAPPPEALLDALVRRGEITPEQKEWARTIPMASDLTAEADSGGHTDNRPALTLLPTFLALRDRLAAEYRYDVPLRVGAAGGIATPTSTAAAFSMGAAYVLVGSVNQACVESGSSDTVRKMLAETEQADVIMAPAADMFEMGVQVQVLKRGTMFAMRGAKLYDLYRRYDSLDEIPPHERAQLEKTIFRAPLEEIWERTCEFFAARDPGQLGRAQEDAKHQMALVFRWYLGLSSYWANQGEPTRKIDYQVWCGPAMGAFNEWTRETFLAAPEARRVETVAHNLMFGAAVALRLNTLRTQGIEWAWGRDALAPLEPAGLAARLDALDPRVPHRSESQPREAQ